MKQIQTLVGNLFGTKTTLEGKNFDDLNPNQRMEIQQMIDAAIDKHNKTATIISMAIGGVLLFFYAHGVLEVVNRVSR
tara:strand:+ start:1622 stop:1855 length:234 start_codon:yes stop_codon:yes gene_type:complete